MASRSRSSKWSRKASRSPRELQAGDLSPLVLGDWLEMIAPVMRDLSPQAHRWWELVELEAKGYYEQWRVATPMARLQIKPKCQAVEKNPTLQRTEQRGISLLVRAIPSSMRETIVAERLLTSTGILFTLLKNYQPGGRGERTTLLKELSNPKYGKTLNDAATTLRSWRRFFRRTEEIGAVLPDPSVLLKALETPNQMVSKVDPQATFRLSQARVSLDIDASPTTTSVWDFSECLLAELDSLILLQGVEVQNKPTDAQQTPAVKAMNAKPPPNGVCRFWGTPNGCRQGKRCGYQHDWQSLDDQSSRCFLCSAQGHRKQDCPTRQQGDSALAGGSGNGGGNQQGKEQLGPGQGRGQSNPKSKGKGKPGGFGNGKGKEASSTSSTTSLSTQGKEQAGLQDSETVQASVRAMQGSSATSSAPATSTAPSVAGSASEQELMGEVASLLKSLRVGEGNPNPQLSAVRLARILNQDKAVLIDGGATHCFEESSLKRGVFEPRRGGESGFGCRISEDEARHGHGNSVLGRSKSTADSPSCGCHQGWGGGEVG